MVGRILRRHQYAVHILSPQGRHRQGAHQRRVDAAAKAQHGTPQAVLAEILADTHHKRLIDKVHSLRLLVLIFRQQLKVDAGALLFEVGELAQHRARRIHRQRAAGKQVRALATDAVDKHQRRVEVLDRLVHTVADAVRLVVVEHVAAAADDDVGLLAVAARQLLQVLVEADGYLLPLKVDALHALAAHEILLLVGSQIFLRNDGPDGTILHENDGVAKTLVLNLQRQAHKEGAVLRTLNQLLQGGLGALLKVGVGCRAEHRIAAQRARRENRQQRVARRLRVQFGHYPFQVLFRIVCQYVVLNNMYVH